MPIKNKNGTAYRLRGPNPIMKEQSNWDRNQLVLHNMKWHGITIQDKSIVESFKSDLILKPEPAVVADEHVDPYINGPVIEIKTETVYQTPRTKPAIADSVPRVVCWCQPAIIRERTDPLYGDVQKTIQYGQKFSFEAVIVESNYVDFKFWTTIDKPTEGSIVFPQNEDRRWWRVAKAEAKTGGWLVYCVISDFQPDFSTVQP